MLLLDLHLEGRSGLELLAEMRRHNSPTRCVVLTMSAQPRMVAEAQSRGANAIIGMRFDSGAIGQWSEICAYGTAVSITPVSETARQQFEAMMAVGRDTSPAVAAATNVWACPQSSRCAPVSWLTSSLSL